MSDWSLGETHVHWLNGGLLVQCGHASVLLDAPRGVVDAIAAFLPTVHGMAVSSGRMASVRGLLALLEGVSLTRPRTAPFTVLGPADDQRVPAIVELWTRGWPGRNPVHLDGLLPGDTADVGGLPVELVSVPHGEPSADDPPQISRMPGYAIRVHTPDGVIAWVPGAAPSSAVRRACRGCVLAVVEVGVVPWPSSDRPWRMTLTDVLSCVDAGTTLWVVGDDGQRMDAAEA